MFFAAFQANSPSQTPHNQPAWETSPRPAQPSFVSPRVFAFCNPTAIALYSHRRSIKRTRINLSA